jgi:hypothetical protein
MSAPIFDKNVTCTLPWVRSGINAQSKISCLLLTEMIGQIYQ